MVFINEANAWGLEFYIHNATDELIKTDSYPAKLDLLKQCMLLQWHMELDSKKISNL
ncbi:MAG: hypothetical protein Ct9H90mP7_3890 [Candidatus Neomarinimicrobiota bacterium]|nr:MAG: hypothetical protein Ct9H90mP7_3890 [Candidatus Neomarinimicrobiota bacterium]